MTIKLDNNIRERIMVDVHFERIHQKELKASGRFKYTCADPEMSDEEALAVLTEESGEAAAAFLLSRIGEVARAVLNKKKLSTDGQKDLRKELIQVAAVAVAWIEKLDGDK